MAPKQFILFYNAETRAGATALIDEGAVLREQHEMKAGTFGEWTHRRLTPTVRVWRQIRSE